MSVEKNINQSSKYANWGWSSDRWTNGFTMDASSFFDKLESEIESKAIKTHQSPYNPDIPDEETATPLTVNPSIIIDPSITISPHWLKKNGS